MRAGVTSTRAGMTWRGVCGVVDNRAGQRFIRTPHCTAAARDFIVHAAGRGLSVIRFTHAQ